MKIAFLSEGKSLDSYLDERFGRANSILLVDSETNETKVIDSADSCCGGHRHQGENCCEDDHEHQNHHGYHEHHGHHGEGHNGHYSRCLELTKEIIDSDAQAVVATHMCKDAFELFKNSRVKIYITKVRKISDILEDILNNNLKPIEK